MPAKTITLDSRYKRAAVFAVGAVALLFAFVVIRWALGNAASTRAEDPEIARTTVGLAPDDAQTHYAAAVLLEKQFDVVSLDAAVKEYEQAAALSPYNYLYWLALGSARERAGDAEGGERALRKALELAPNYARVHWALGNALVRQGRVDEGFAEIREAVAGDPKLADLAASTAWVLLDGDVTRVRVALGESERLNASLALLLANEKRFDEAINVWESLSAEARTGPLAETGNLLSQKLLEAKRFRFALKIRGEASGNGGREGEVSNGGFEEPIKSQNTDPFSWQIAAGQQPQIAPTSGQKHGGNLSIVLILNSTESRDFRTISQTVAVVPGGEYSFEAYYRSDLKTKAGFIWEVVGTANNAVIAATEPTAPSADWTRMTVRFRVPAEADGIVLRLGRVNCDGPVCQVAGNLWFDDISLKRID